MRKKIYCDKNCVFALKEETTLILQCTSCENKERWLNLDTAQKCLVILYEQSLEKGNLELAQSTHELIKAGGFENITDPEKVGFQLTNS